jgi:hypothetical protein
MTARSALSTATNGALAADAVSNTETSTGSDARPADATGGNSAVIIALSSKARAAAPKKHFRTRQASAAMGLDNGAIQFQSDPAAGFKAGIAFLDSVSAEEKAGFDWAAQRAAIQFSYEMIMRRDGKEPENLDSTHPIVKMIKGALDALAATGDPSKQVEDMPQYKQAKVLHTARAGAGASNLADASA